MIVQRILCDYELCKKEVDENSDEFITVMGNICVGLTGGLVGNNLDEDNFVEKHNHFCWSCFKHIIDEAEDIKNERRP